MAIESAKEVDEDLNEEDDEAEEEDALAENVVDAPESAKTAAVSKPIVWEEYGKKIVDGLTFYRYARLCKSSKKYYSYTLSDVSCSGLRNY